MLRDRGLGIGEGKGDMGTHQTRGRGDTPDAGTRGIQMKYSPRHRVSHSPRLLCLPQSLKLRCFR
jgi:hypothetical protein